MDDTPTAVGEVGTTSEGENEYMSSARGKLDVPPGAICAMLEGLFK